MLQKLQKWVDNIDATGIEKLTDDELLHYSGLLRKNAARLNSKADDLMYDLMHIYVMRGRSDPTATHSAVDAIEECHIKAL